MHKSVNILKPTELHIDICYGCEIYFDKTVKKFNKTENFLLHSYLPQFRMLTSHMRLGYHTDSADTQNISIVMESSTGQNCSRTIKDKIK